MMKRILSIILRYVALVTLYMLVSWSILEIFGTFNTWRVLIMGCIFCAIVLGISESKRKNQ